MVCSALFSSDKFTVSVKDVAVDLCIGDRDEGLRHREPGEGDGGDEELDRCNERPARDGGDVLRSGGGGPLGTGILWLYACVCMRVCAVGEKAGFGPLGGALHESIRIR